MLTHNNEQITTAADRLQVLAHPTCIRIILGLTRPTSLNVLQQRLQIGKAPLTQHLTELKESGLLCSERWGEELYYSLTDANLTVAIQQLLARIKS